MHLTLLPGRLGGKEDLGGYLIPVEKEGSPGSMSSFDPVVFFAFLSFYSLHKFGTELSMGGDWVGQCNKGR